MKSEDMKESLGCLFVLCNFDILDSEFIVDLFAAGGDNSGTIKMAAV